MTSHKPTIQPRDDRLDMLAVSFLLITTRRKPAPVGISCGDGTAFDRFQWFLGPFMTAKMPKPFV